MKPIAVPLVALTLLTLGTAARIEPAFAAGQSQSQSDDWCRDENSGDRDQERFCEVRHLTMAAPETLHVSTSNGSVVLTGSARRDISIDARVVAQAELASEAKQLAQQVRITTDGGRIDADGPRTGRHQGWWVSYRIETPSRSNIVASSSNGSVNATGISGHLDFDTSNGSVKLFDLSGDVRATTSNGSLQVSLSGTTWSGAGLEARTSNGSMHVEMPRDYNAHLIASTGNGSMNIDRPITVTGRIGRSIDTDLGKGGPTVRFTTSNGSLSIKNK